MSIVSIIVPVYKVEKYIEKCVRSLINQTLHDIEIILVDDGSPDHAGKICDALSFQDARIHVIHQKNQGVSAARNTGIEYATGDWLLFVDGDDWTDENLCRNMSGIAGIQNADIVICNYFTANKDHSIKSKLVPLSGGDVSEEKELIQLKTISQYYGGNVMNNGVSAGTCWCKLVRRSLIMENNIRFITGLSRAQDTVFWLYAFEAAKRIYLLDDFLYYYRISDSSICYGTKYMPACERPFGMLLSEYRKFINYYAKGTEFTDALRVRTIQVLAWHVSHKYFHPDYTSDLGERINSLKKLAHSMPYKDAIQNVNMRYLFKRLKLLVILCRLRMYRLYYLLFRLYKL